MRALGMSVLNEAHVLCARLDSWVCTPTIMGESAWEWLTEHAMHALSIPFYSYRRMP